MDQGFPILIIIGFVVVAIAFWAISSHLEQKRREALFVAATEMGLQFSPGRDFNLPHTFGFLDKLDQGSERYAFNKITGEIDSVPVIVFDYHYATYSHNKNGRQTHHHYFSFYMSRFSRSFPELKIYRENVFGKIAQAVGFDDIDFESAAFSRTFEVRSRDKKFAYDFCNARMIEYLLRNTDLNIEVEDHFIGLFFNRRLTPEELRNNLRRLKSVHSLVPDYLFR